ncbi:MAG: ABC transporter permease, partial [Candidatus Hodarchaeota archaeon]
REQLRRDFGLDEPVTTQFWHYLTRSFRGDMGISIMYFPTPVMDVILQRLPWTILVMGLSTILSILIAIPLGAKAAWNYRSKTDSIISLGSLTTRTVPTFWLALVLMLIFGYYLRWFPLTGNKTIGLEDVSLVEKIMDILKHATLPVVSLMAYLLAGNIFIIRPALLDVLPEDYMLIAKAKGLPNSKILYRHGFRNALLPILTWIALQFGFIVSGAVLVEFVFAYPGIGKLLVDAAFSRDYFLLQGAFLILNAAVLVSAFIADILNIYLDPRIGVE